MAKKKQSDSSPATTDDAAQPDTIDTAPAVSNSPADDLGGLAQDVQEFIARREQLAQRLADEIAATEKKLAELKRTAAALFPEKESAPSPAKERKSKGVAAAKPTKRRQEAPPSESPAAAARAAAEEEPAADEGAIQEGAPHEPHLD